MPTLQEAVSSKFGDSAWNLLNDAGEAASVRKSIGYCIVGDDQIITNMPFEQVKMALSVAKFATDDEEVVYVARMVFVTVGKTNILPMISCHRGFDLASRCLVALSLFKKALDHRTKFRGCPSASFYSCEARKPRHLQCRG